jgi:hypothetical protein
VTVATLWRGFGVFLTAQLFVLVNPGTEVEAHLMSIHEGGAYDTVILVNIDEVVINLVVYVAKSYGNSCPIADLGSATDTSKLEDNLLVQLEHFGLRCEGEFRSY